MSVQRSVHTREQEDQRANLFMYLFNRRGLLRLKSVSKKSTLTESRRGKKDVHDSRSSLRISEEDARDEPS